MATIEGITSSTTSETSNAIVAPDDFPPLFVVVTAS